MRAINLTQSLALPALWLAVLGALCVSVCAVAGEAPSKRASTFFPVRLVQKARANAKRFAWAAEIQRQVVEDAGPWMKMSDDELWGLMFGNTITRSWMVWSNGHCPACKKSVPMYTWEIDALGRPWKVRCPHCKAIFPTNDFLAFYRSGLDEHGVFDPKRADRRLLFNAKHPDPKDPRHQFGVDDGEGYVAGRTRWRFIGAYLIYGQWKQAVLGGIQRLSAAYVVTGDPAYAHKAGVLLDRVADLYPTFDFRRQGVVYERPGAAGYVSTWHDACEETRELAIAYDRVFEALRSDKQLVAFLAEKARRFKLSNPKATFEHVQANIEDRILRDALRNPHKIHSNYPRAEITKAILKSVLDWPKNRPEVNAMADQFIRRATRVDGVSGEKGLAGYSSFVIQGLAQFLGEYERAEPAFLQELLKRHPQLHQTYRFHIDTWCLQHYYPLSGDTGSFAGRFDRYQGVSFGAPASLRPSMYTFLWRMYELTGDPAFAQVVYHANGNSVAGLPHDMFAGEPAALQRKVAEVIAREGAAPKLGSVNKQQWHLAILRSGKGPDARALWLDYDSGCGGHSHRDGMNLGLFARGLDLLPDFGYPPVQYGGWSSPRANWYKATAAHNTVVVDGRNLANAAAKTTLWADGQSFRAIRASGAQMIRGKQYERTAALIEISDRDFYVADVFRVVGGTDHAKFTHSHFGTIAPKGLSLKPAASYGHGTQMRNFRCDPNPTPGWSVDWKIEDRYRLLPRDAEVHFRYTDLTTGAQAFTAEAWVVTGGYNTSREAWIPRVMVRRRTGKGPLASTFVSVIEPYEEAPKLAGIRRLPLHTPEGNQYPDPNVALDVRLADGRRDLIIAADVENPLALQPSWSEGKTLVQGDQKVSLDGQLCFIRRSEAGAVRRVAMCRARALRVGELALRLSEAQPLIEIAVEGRRASVVVGNAEAIEDILLRDKSIWRK